MNLLTSAAKVSSMTMLSRILGLVRETLIARAFGASEMTDAFNVAFRLPNLLRRLFAEGAFSQAFVPILSETNTKFGPEKSKQLINVVSTLLFWALLLVVILGVVFTPFLVLFVASGFKNQETFELSVILTRIMFPYIGFISMVSLAAGILNTNKRFMVPAFTPVLLNLGMICGALFLAPKLSTPIYGLAIGVMIGGFLQLVLQIPFLLKLGMLPKIGITYSTIKSAMRDSDAKRILKLMGPAVFAVSVSQISLIINTNIASHLATGSVSWLSYADRLMEFPTALLGVAVGTVLLPSLSKANAAANYELAGKLVNWGIRLTFLIASPAAIALFVFGEPLATSLYHYGKFSSHDVAMTTVALQAYGVGLIGLILVKVLAPGFYARQDIKTPVKIGLFVLAMTQLSNYILVPYLQHTGLALSIGIGACINAALLWVGLYRRGVMRFGEQQWLKFFARIVLGVGMFGVVLHFGANYHNWIELQVSPLTRILLMMAWGSGAILVYFLTLWIIGFKFKEFLRHSH
ncbi:murein biosynthesis integral membrane protein MurJ [Polynucleobacter kasalickyi]|uniref:Probable lipid II flippase MurJ n=1 Tax=Polynucleobacter kasalickyi TaxID=1938817 RepID=A0A1W1YI62_9BURK|nr:murein biosynthesis integral membrane protein MurJ [Polynucleobacter kasalickyi]SMC35438.1 putative peptidoglycan lipid II flippase [Polynucleobacter kasalickyi]